MDVDGNKATTKAAETSQRSPSVAEAGKATQPNREKTKKVEKPAHAVQITAARDSKGIYTLSDSSVVTAKAPAEKQAEIPPVEKKAELPPVEKKAEMPPAEPNAPQTPATPSAE